MKTQHLFLIILAYTISVIIACERNEKPFGIAVSGGVNKIEINTEDNYFLSAETYFPEAIPNYSWESGDESVLSINAHEDNKAIATLTATGNVGQQAEIFVTDDANALNRSVQVTIIESPYGKFTDFRDNQTYKTIRIGNQLWMAENLNYETTIGDWNYDNEASNADTFGKLYNWEAAQKVCPNGWRLPTYDDWFELENYLIDNGYTDDGNTLVNNLAKAMSATSDWEITSTNSWDIQHTGSFYLIDNNSSGFRALPGGCREDDGSFSAIGKHAYFWIDDKNHGDAYKIAIGQMNQSNFFTTKETGFSVRCIAN